MWLDAFRIYDNHETVDIFNVYRPLHRDNLNAFFEKMSVSLNEEIIRYENVINSGRF